MENTRQILEQIMTLSGALDAVNRAGDEEATKVISAKIKELASRDLGSSQEVKVGDIVLYCSSPNQEYDKYARNNNAHEIPALVTAVHSEDCINLTVFPDAPFDNSDFTDPADNKTYKGGCPTAFSVTSACKLPEGTHNPQTGMWKFK